MALVSCPECGRDRVSDSASACPECGFNVREYFSNNSVNISISNKEGFGKSIGEKPKRESVKAQNASQQVYNRTIQVSSQSSSFETGRKIGRNLGKLLANHQNKLK